MIKVFSSIRSTYRAVSVAIDGEHISNDMRRSLELVRTCNQDLQELITLRNEHLHLLEKQPRSLERLNSIIEKVHNGLLDASRIVEKYRPELHSGKKSLQTQIAWAHRDSQEFQALGPTMSQHNATILAEISFLRSLTIITTQSEPEKTKESIGSDDKTIFNNMELLEDFIGNVSGSRDLPPVSPPIPPPPPPPPAIKVNARASMPNLLMNQEYCDLPEPVIPNIIPHQQPTTTSLASEQASSLWTLGGPTLDDGNQRNSRIVLNQADHSGLSLLFADELDLIFDLSSKVQPQHSGAQSSSSMHKSSMPSFSSSSVNGGTVNSTPSTKYSLTSKPSTLSIGSMGTFNQQSPQLSTNRPHLFSHPASPPTNTTQLASLSVTSLTSEIQQDTRSRPPVMPFAERYANATNHSDHQNQRHPPWRPYNNANIYELQGSDASPAVPPFTQSTTSLANRSNTQ